MISIDPLDFVDTKPYPARLKQAKKSSGLPEAIVNGRGKVGNHLVFAGAMDMSFIGGSMGSAVGEKVTRLIERALKEHGAVVIFSASGGARMQEGTLSLMQMAKISAALAELDEARLPFISVLTDPTTGGVTASFAMLGDFIIAEPKALIGFAGPRVIEQTIRQKLPKDFQKIRVSFGARHARCNSGSARNARLHDQTAQLHAEPGNLRASLKCKDRFRRLARNIPVN